MMIRREETDYLISIFISSIYLSIDRDEEGDEEQEDDDQERRDRLSYRKNHYHNRHTNY